MSSGRLGMVLKKAFGDFWASYTKDEGQLCHTEEGGWAIIGMLPEAAHVLDRNGGYPDKQFSYEWSKANRQPYVGGLLRPHHLEKSNTIAQRLRDGDLLAGPNGVVWPRNRDGAGEEGHKRRRSPSIPPPPGWRTDRRTISHPGVGVDMLLRRRNHTAVAAVRLPNLRRTHGTAGTPPVRGEPVRRSPQLPPRGVERR